MIVDLATVPEGHHRCEADVLIIGGGIAGLVLANKLRASGIPVIVLESGGREQTCEIHPLNRVVETGKPYSGATLGRFRCLGGTSTRWGGALIPFSDHDLAARPYIGVPKFPVAPDALMAYLPEAQKIFGIDDKSFDEEFVHQINAAKYVPTGDREFLTRFAKWPTFRNRNLAVVFRSKIEHDAGLRIWINSTATSFDVEKESGRLRSVTAQAEGNRYVSVTAKQVVICAGAIESTRLLLLLDQQYQQRISKRCAALGRFFNDHISMGVATIRAKRAAMLNHMAAFRFLGSTMRSLRFELAPLVQERECIGNAFGHISFRTEKSTGFDLLREFLRTLQRTGKVDVNFFTKALREGPYLVKLALWRILYKQLLWPVPAIYELHVVAEQIPRAENAISLSSQKDMFGLPLAAIQWQISSQEMKTFAVYKQCFEAFWSRQGLNQIGELDWTLDTQNAADHLSSADVYHPGGSTRMGTDHHHAVVDPNLRLFDIDNLWVASTSVFPSGGGENPTLMLILFTMRLADQLKNSLRAF